MKIERSLPPPTEAEALGVSDYDLADLLRKPSLGNYDRANHNIIYVNYGKCTLTT
jgi:hypothetical protein